MKRNDQDDAGKTWEFGDDWKQGAPDDSPDASDVEFVEILRGDIGSGFDDSYMLELVTYLGSRGIIATYDSFSAGMEMGAIKTYVLKVESGKEQQAIEFLREKL